MHKAERRTANTRTVRETEAEAIAFVVSQTIGLDAGRAAVDYIHLYHGNAALLTESLEVIQRTSALILAAIEPHASSEQTTNPEPEPDDAADDFFGLEDQRRQMEKREIREQTRTA